MSKTYNIPKPCNQGWQNMSPAGENRFCQSCKKEVVDFTNKSPEDIINYLNQNPKSCGHFKTKQLEEINRLKRSHNTNFSKYAAVLAVTAFLGIYSPTDAKPLRPQVEFNTQSQWTRVLPKPISSDTITLSGQVKDNDGLPVPGVNVILKGSQIGTQTDFDGNFEMTLNVNDLKPENTLVITYMGYHTLEYRFQQKSQELDITLNPNEEMMDGEIVIQRNVFQKVGFFFKRLFSKKY